MKFIIKNQLAILEHNGKVIQFPADYITGIEKLGDSKKRLFICNELKKKLIRNIKSKNSKADPTKNNRVIILNEWIKEYPWKNIRDIQIVTEK